MRISTNLVSAVGASNIDSTVEALAKMRDAGRTHPCAAAVVGLLTARNYLWCDRNHRRTVDRTTGSGVTDPKSRQEVKGRPRETNVTHLECPPEPALSCLGQERHDALCDGIGIALATLGRLHLGRVVGVAHVAGLDEHGGILGEVEAREVGATG